MITSLDHLIVAVKDLEKAEMNFSEVFGVPPVWRGEHPELGTHNSIFNFKNTYLEILSSNGNGIGAEFIDAEIRRNGEGLVGLVLGTDNINNLTNKLKEKKYLVGDPLIGEGINLKSQEKRKWDYLFLPAELTRGIFSFIIQHTSGTLPKLEKYPSDTIKKLDHVVINTKDPEGFIKVYRDVFGIRLALDKVIEHWKTRILFFRLNKTTIEVIAKDNDQESQDNLWGLAWEVDSIEKTYARLVKQGIDVTPIKKGVKPNSLVATIKSHVCGIPTLLIEHT